MPSKGSCRICDHPRAGDINAELLALGKNRRSLRSVASLFHVSPETLRRHYRECLGQGSVDEPNEAPQEPEPVYGGSIKVTHEQVSRAIALDEEAQKATPQLMVVITRKLTELLANVLKDAGNR